MLLSPVITKSAVKFQPNWPLEFLLSSSVPRNVNRSPNLQKFRHFSSEKLNLTCCMLGNFLCLFCHWLIYFFKIRNTISKQFRSRPNILPGLIWVQTVCTGYQQTALAGKEINTYYHNSNLIWRTVSRRVGEVIPSDHPRRVTSRVI